MGLTDSSWKKIVEGRRKTEFLLFLLHIEAIERIFENFVISGPLDYVLTYKFSQAGLREFFIFLFVNIIYLDKDWILRLFTHQRDKLVTWLFLFYAVSLKPL